MAAQNRAKKSSGSLLGVGCLWIVGIILWVILLIFGPFGLFSAFDLKADPNVTFRGYIVTKTVTPNDGRNFYVLEVGPNPNKGATDTVETVTVPERAYNAAQIGWYIEGEFESDDHLLRAVMKESPTGTEWVRIVNASTEASSETFAWVLTGIWGVLTVVMIILWITQSKNKKDKVKVPPPSVISVAEGTMMIGSGSNTTTSYNAFPPAQNPNAFPPPANPNAWPQQGTNNFPPPNNPNNWPPPKP